MMQSSGYFFVASKFAGLIRIPSMVVPSWLFHEITSRVPRVKLFAWSFRLVNFRGAKRRVPDTNTSFMLAGEPAAKAIASPFLVSEKLPAIRSSGDETRVI